MEFLNPAKAGAWGWVAIIGGVLTIVGVLLPWLNLWGLAYPTGIELGLRAMSSGLGLIIFAVGNIIFILILGIAGLALVFAKWFKLGMMLGIVAGAFCGMDLVIYIIGFGDLLSVGPFVTMAGVMMLAEGASGLSRGTSGKTTQLVIQESGAAYGASPYPAPPRQDFPDYSGQNLYGPRKGP